MAPDVAHHEHTRTPLPTLAEHVAFTVIRDRFAPAETVTPPWCSAPMLIAAAIAGAMLFFGSRDPAAILFALAIGIAGIGLTYLLERPFATAAAKRKPAEKAPPSLPRENARLHCEGLEADWAALAAAPVVTREPHVQEYPTSYKSLLIFAGCVGAISLLLRILFNLGTITAMIGAAFLSVPIALFLRKKRGCISITPGRMDLVKPAWFKSIVRVTQTIPLDRADIDASFLKRRIKFAWTDDEEAQHTHTFHFRTGQNVHAFVESLFVAALLPPRNEPPITDLLPA